jgi:toxin ParE1/3/4
MSLAWHVRLAEQAERDLLDITLWTAENFGRSQAEFYAETVTLALEALHDGPEILGAKARDDDIGLGIRTLHVAREGRKGRHFVVFKVSNGQNIDVLRLLHDSMDLARHVSGASNQTL